MCDGFPMFNIALEASKVPRKGGKRQKAGDSAPEERLPPK